MDSEIDYKLIGKRIKENRKKAGLTQDQLAAQLHYSKGYISQLERGISRPNLDTLGNICSILCCDVAELLKASARHSYDYMTDEINELYEKLSQEERHILYQLLKSYIKLKNS